MTDHRVTCHCGAVEMRVRLNQAVQTAARCNCSFCSRRGAIVVEVPLEDLKIIKGQENLTLYRWGTGTAQHYFCKTCGNYTHHQQRLNPNKFGVNLAAIEGIEFSDLENVPWNDGVNHPSDAAVD